MMEDNRLEVVRLQKAISNLEGSVNFLDYHHSVMILDIIHEYNKRIKEYELKNVDVIELTPKEKGIISSSLKKTTKSLINDLEPILTEAEFRKLYNELKRLCNKTVLSNKVISMKVLLSRKYKNWYEMRPIDIEINRFVLLEMINEFIGQNPQFINKINNIKQKKYEASKH